MYSVHVTACCGRLSVVYCFTLSDREIVKKSFLRYIMHVCVEYFVYELVSGYRIEGLTPVYCCKKCSQSRICIRPSRIFCVMSVRRVFRKWLGLRPCLMGESVICGVMFCRTNFSSILEGEDRSYISL